MALRHAKTIPFFLHTPFIRRLTMGIDGKKWINESFKAVGFKKQHPLKKAHDTPCSKKKESTGTRAELD